MNIRLLLILLLVSCSVNTNKQGKNQKFAGTEIYKAKYAKGFSITQKGDTTSLKIINPWQHSDVEIEYYLVSEARKDKYNEIKIPVERAVCMSTTHLAFLASLDKLPAVKGVSGIKHSSNTYVLNGFETKQILEVGYDTELSYELIYSLNPDVVFAYGVEGEFENACTKLNAAGIKVVYIGEYLENTPLGKAEWIIPISLFFNEKPKADSLFTSIEKEYLLALNSTYSNRPKIMPNVPFKDVWYLPGSESSMAEFINDAGGDYIFNSPEKRETYPMNIEQAFMLAQGADLMIIGDMSVTLNDLKNNDKRLSLLPAFKNKRIYNNNKRVNKYGGNDFWESGVTHPHIILKDLIKIFHPNLLPQHQLYYYRRLE